MPKYFKHRGVSELVYAPLIKDDKDAIEWGDVKPLAPVSRIGKTTEANSATEYYDNLAYFVISSEGPDEFEMDTTAFDLETEAELLGKSYDPETGAYIDGPRIERYFAVGYKTKGNDGGERYVWRFKVKFSPIDAEHNTENDGTDTTGATIKCTGINTTHKFAKGVYDAAEKKWTSATSKGIVVDSRDGIADLSTFFDSVVDPDTIKAKGAA